MVWPRHHLRMFYHLRGLLSVLVGILEGIFFRFFCVGCRIYLHLKYIVKHKARLSAINKNGNKVVIEFQDGIPAEIRFPSKLHKLMAVMTRLLRLTLVTGKDERDVPTMRMHANFVSLWSSPHPTFIYPFFFVLIHGASWRTPYLLLQFTRKKLILAEI